VTDMLESLTATVESGRLSSGGGLIMLREIASRLPVLPSSAIACGAGFLRHAYTLYSFAIPE
jgi:hypothetical protein